MPTDLTTVRAAAEAFANEQHRYQQAMCGEDVLALAARITTLPALTLALVEEVEQLRRENRQLRAQLEPLRKM